MGVLGEVQRKRAYRLKGVSSVSSGSADTFSLEVSRSLLRETEPNRRDPAFNLCHFGAYRHKAKEYVSSTVAFAVHLFADFASTS
ncbi:unnamed protein product [Protopolystoma xenopodis]|uniref:Uncharacterized protein n=1 Tax=Protopolystoma xenopodis TaxID=117903 RepID=A0A3S5FG06_9PLAT|nr:unnamed protein product [Protopolystoma xenopodis]